MQHSPLQLRDLRIRDSDNVVTYGGHNLQQLAAALPEEECKNVVQTVHTARQCCCPKTVSAHLDCLVQCG